MLTNIFYLILYFTFAPNLTRWLTLALRQIMHQPIASCFDWSDDVVTIHWCFKKKKDNPFERMRYLLSQDLTLSGMHIGWRQKWWKLLKNLVRKRPRNCDWIPSSNKRSLPLYQGTNNERNTERKRRTCFVIEMAGSRVRPKVIQFGSHVHIMESSSNCTAWFRLKLTRERTATYSYAKSY